MKVGFSQELPFKLRADGEGEKEVLALPKEGTGKVRDAGVVSCRRCPHGVRESQGRDVTIRSQKGPLVPLKISLREDQGGQRGTMEEVRWKELL